MIGRAASQAIERLAFTGPRAVVINAAGETTRWRTALKEHGIWSIMAFVRNDGWTLGAPAEFAAVAYKLWEAEWEAVIFVGHEVWVMDIADWRASGRCYCGGTVPCADCGAGV